MTPAPLDGLLARMDHLAWRLERGELAALEAVPEVAREAGTMGATLQLAEGEAERLWDRMEHLFGAVQGAAATLRQRAGQVAAGRRAVRAYSPERRSAAPPRYLRLRA